MAPKDKDLEPIHDKKIVERYLRYAMDLRETVSCFVETGAFRFDCIIKNFESVELKLELEPTPESNQALTSTELKIIEAAQTPLRISFAVNDILYFSQAKVLNRSSGRTVVSIELPIYKLQRRDAMRIKILNEHKSTITVDGKAYIPHDLSATGLSFVVMQDEANLFPLRRMIQSCKLKFSSLESLVNLEVMSVSRVNQDNERLLKVGFRFMGLSPAIEQQLAREAYLYTHKIWSRRL